MEVNAISTTPTANLLASAVGKLEKLALHVSDLSSSLQATLSNKSTVSSIDSHMPFKLIEFMATQVAKKFIESMISKTENHLFAYSGSITSCIDNLEAISIIFFGENAADVIMNRMCRRNKTAFDVDFPNLQEKTYKYVIDNLFSGAIVHILDNQFRDGEGSDQEESAIVHQHENDFLSSYHAYMAPIIYACGNIGGVSNGEKTAKVFKVFENALSKTGYEFNRSTLELLKREIETNSIKINDQSSFIYSMEIIRPSINDGCVAHHALAIEQFFDSDQGTVRYRIYQSWQGKMDLASFLRKRNYNSQGFGCLSKEEIQEFLYDLEILVCKTPLGTEQITAAHERAFGIAETIPFPLSCYDLNKKILKGVSLCYISRNINPNNCLKNFVEFIVSKPELEKEVQQILANQSSNRN